MKQRLLQLMAGSVGLWLLLALPAYWLGGGLGIVHSLTAAVLCSVPTAATLVWCDLAFSKSPEHQLGAVLGGTGLRMVFVIAVGMVLTFGVDGFASPGFWLWIVVFYLATLALETFLVVRGQAGLDKASGVNHPPG